jgi:hypothetical protein
MAMRDLSALKNHCVDAFLYRGNDGDSLARFHAAADPETVLELVERLEAAEKRLAEADVTDPTKQATESKLAMLCCSPTPVVNLTAYFASFDRWHWPEIADEGKRLLEEELDQPIEEDSTLEKVISGVAMQSSQGAYSAAAAMLGIDGRALQAIALAWEESQHNPPAAITFDELRTKIMLYRSLASVSGKPPA